MSEKRYRIVFSGAVANDTDVASVQQALVRKFKLPEAQVLQLFSGRRAVLKKDLDEPSAERYREAFLQVGALVSVEAMAGASAVIAAPPPPPSPVAASAAVPSALALEPKPEDSAAIGGMALEPTDDAPQPGQRVAPDLGGPARNIGAPPGTPSGVSRDASARATPRAAPDLGGPASGSAPKLTSDPYAPPSSEQLLVDADADDSTVHAPVMVGMGRGWTWIADALKLFGRNPGVWIGIIVITFVLLMILGFIPIVNLLASIILPVLMGGMMIGVHRLARGGELEIGDLFEGFKVQAGPLMLVGVLYLGGYLVVLGLTFGMILGGGAAMGLLAGDGAAFEQMIAGGEFALFGFLILISLALTLLLSAMLWFSPALIVLHNVPLFRALGWSVVGCFKNFLPFLLYSIVMLPAVVVASIPVFLGWLVLGPVIVASIYTAYRDIYLDDAL
jgi:hypothetical protein